MNWQEILIILVPMLSLMGWIYGRIEKKMENGEKKMENGFLKLENEIKEVKAEISSVKERLTRLEGRFDERGYWEAREWRKTGTDDKK